MGGEVGGLEGGKGVRLMGVESAGGMDGWDGMLGRERGRQGARSKEQAGSGES